MKIDIYKIYNNDMAYIGSSHRFKKRMINHKSSCYNEKSSKYNLFIYQYIRTHGGWDQFTKEIIHTCEVKDKTEQRMVEQEFIKNNECKLNMCNSYRTEEEEIEYKKEWYKSNKDKINERQKQKTTCECGSTFIKKDKNRHERAKKHIQFMESK